VRGGITQSTRLTTIFAIAREVSRTPSQLAGEIEKG
jgi:hypothetical protein